VDGGRNDHCIVGKGVSRVKRNFGFLFVALFGGGVGLGLVVIVCMIPVMVFFLLPFFFFFAPGRKKLYGVASRLWYPCRCVFGIRRAEE